MESEDPDFEPDLLAGPLPSGGAKGSGKGRSAKASGAREKARSKRESKAERKARSEQKKAFEAQREEKIRVLWAEFNSLFPTDSDCLRALCFGYDSTDGVVRCFYCSNTQSEQDFAGRKTACLKCGNEIWYTADGPFRDSKKPRAWLAHIWLMGKGMLLGSSAFHRLVGVAQSTAADIFKAVAHRVLHVMDSADFDSVLMASARFIETFIRRSDQTPRKAHPSEEQLACEQDCLNDPVDSPADSQSEVEYSASYFQESFTSRDGASSASARNGSGLENQVLQDIDSLSLASTSLIPEFGEVSDSDSSWNARFAELAPLTFGILEKTVLSVLGGFPQHLDRICQLLGATVNEVAAILTVFEMEGLVSRHPGDKYSLNQLPWLNSRAISKNEGMDKDASSVAGSLSLMGGWASSSSSSSSSSGDAATDGASRVPGGQLMLPSLETEIALFHRFIQLIYQGISRKYLCHYLAAYWIQISERWRGDSLLRLMQARGPVLRDEIQASMSPLYVRFPCLETAEEPSSHEYFSRS